MIDLPSINPIDFKRRYDAPPQVSAESEPETPITFKPSIYPDRNFIPWDLSELEAFFQNTKLPDHPIQLNPWTRIINPAVFVSSHMEFLRHNNGNPTFRPYLDRLIEFRNLFQLSLKS